MSDLQCAATLVVARHGEAEFDESVLSDAGGRLTDLGRQQARELAESLRGRRIALVYTSGMARARQTADIVADVLGVPVRVSDGLQELSVGDYAGEPDWGALRPVLDAWAAGDLDVAVPGGETGRQLIDRFTRELDAIADLHRGETVLLVSHGGVMSLALRHLAANLRRDRAPDAVLSNTSTIELRADADGWVCVSWAGHEPQYARLFD